ncbi:rCG32816 [Rattus norvegicus]|uniref:RCG32816 n=1 Tax=Rattus norvegicus TaxID=10116 RepID=A6HIQ2_RAT|nr:rCG32816 [Rattus norvegicus]
MERGVKSPLGNSSRPGEWPSVGAGLVRKQASSSPHTAKSRSGPAAGAQGSHQDCPATPRSQRSGGAGLKTEFCRQHQEQQALLFD